MTDGRKRRRAGALHLLDLQLAELPPPPIISHFAHADLADRLDMFCPARPGHSIYRRLRDDLFGLVALFAICSPP